VKYALAMMAVIILICVAYVGVGFLGLYSLFGVVLPCVAIAVFVIGIVFRAVQWAKIPVPFHVPTVCGQQKSLSWIKADNLESPYTVFGVIKRMAMEVFLFRSLFRNDKANLGDQGRVIYGANRFLWAGGLVFHWSLLIVAVRHLRFFLEPVPSAIIFLQKVDGLFDIAVPTVLVTDFLLIVALTYLVARRVVTPQIRYLSLASDYFPLFLIGAIVMSGILMRNLFNVDLFAVKKLVTGIAGFQVVLPAEIGLIFYIHLFLVCVLLAYLPFSKLTHMAGVFFSPTRNLVNNSRMIRHINPWNHPVRVHSYEEYEDEFRGAMKEAGLPVEKENG
jgi:nitrate reductase gamma subunit